MQHANETGASILWHTKEVLVKKFMSSRLLHRRHTMTSRCDPHHTERYNDEVALKNNSEPNGSSTSNTSLYPNNFLVTRRSASKSNQRFLFTNVISNDTYKGPCPRYWLCVQCVSVHDGQETNDQALVVEECVMWIITKHTSVCLLLANDKACNTINRKDAPAVTTA